MAVFARRVLQRCIDESLSYTSHNARHIWVSKLNSSSEPAYAATEWEIVLLHTLSKFGTLQHEPKLPGGTSKLDIVFDSPTVFFGADITTISDRGLHEKNPIRELEKQLKTIYKDADISGGGIVFTVLDLSPHSQRTTGESSIVPPVRDFKKIVFNESFYNWLSAIRENPNERSQHQIIYRNPRSVIGFTYVPGRQGAYCGQYTNYRIAKSAAQNPLYKNLASKASQIKKSGFGDRAGIFVCDGGTDSLRESFSGNISTSDIVFEFLRRHSSVNFVAVFALRNVHTSTIRQRAESRIYVRQEESWHRQLSELVTQVTTALPQVIQTAENAENELKFWEGKKRIHLGRLSMKIEPAGIRELRMSTRTLLDVLSGRLPQKHLNEHYCHDNGKGIFECLVAAGSLIESARVERKPTEDDDEIVFTFSGPDSAASPFRMPTEYARGGGNLRAEPHER